MIVAIGRLTTGYVDTEDRLRLSGAVANAPPVAMWLTQRLALRFRPQPPVQAAVSHGWLIQAVDLAPAGERIGDRARRLAARRRARGALARRDAGPGRARRTAGRAASMKRWHDT